MANTASEPAERNLELVHNLLLPTLFFAALGGMSWAVRGCAGFGGSAGCIFAGVLWGTAWWFAARHRATASDADWAWPARRYTSGWIVLALTVGIGLSGARGWMQWSSFFEGKLQTDYAAGEYVPISRTYGFVWLFIAGMPWAGIGACMLAWCSPLRTTRAWHWGLRIACGLGVAALGLVLFKNFPQFFMPLYEEHLDRYQDLANNPNLRRLTNDNRNAIMHLGLYLGFLLYEVGRRDWKNVVLIATVGIVNGIGWALCQNWKWHADAWPGTSFNWWRCWESSGGISIGIAYGVAFFLVNRPMRTAEREALRARRSLNVPSFEWLAVYLGLTALLILPAFFEAHWTSELLLAAVALFGIAYYWRNSNHHSTAEQLPRANGDANLERFGLGLGLLLGLGFSLSNGLRGYLLIHGGDEAYYDRLLWQIVGPAMLVLLVALGAWILRRPLPKDFAGDAFPRAVGIVWLVLIWQNVLAQGVTGPWSAWPEFAFAVYYVLLFLITAVIVVHYSERARRTDQTALN
ncbi:MAG: hypothetical protein AB7U73_05635 [Pirellulales bacterium]